MLDSYLIIAGVVIILVETLVIFLILFGIFKFTGWKSNIRNILLLLFSYPGIFAAVGGWIGIMAPVPLIIGAPFQLAMFFTGSNDAAWIPAPFFNLILPNTGIVATELGILISWLFLILLLTGKLKKLSR